MLAKRWFGNVPMMVRVYRWCRKCHSPRLQALRLAWGLGLSGLEISYALALELKVPAFALPGSV